MVNLRFFKQIAFAWLSLALIAGCSSVTPSPTALPLASSTVASNATATQPLTQTATVNISSTPLPTAYTGLVPPDARLRLGKGPLRLVEASADIVLVGSPIIVCAYQVANGSQDWCRTTGEAPGSILSTLSMSPDGNTYLTGLENGTVTLWDTPSGKQLGAAANVILNSVAWSPNSQQVVYSTRDLFLHILDSRDGSPVASIPLVGIPPSVLSWSPDGKLIAAGDNSGQIAVYDTLTGQAIMAHGFFPAEHYVSSLAWSKDSSKIVAGSSFISCLQNCSPTYSGKLVMVDAHSGGLSWQVDAGDQVHSLALSLDGGTVLARVGDQALKLYAMADGTLSQSIPTSDTLDVSWLPTGQGILSVDQNANLVTWGLAATQQATQHLEGYYNLNNFAWSRDSTRLATSTTDGQVLIWDASNGTLIKSLAEGVTDEALAWSPDAKQIATLQGQKIIFWNVNTGDQEKTLEGVGQFSTGQGWSPDGKSFATFDANGLTIWDTNNWTVSLLIAFNKPVPLKEFHGSIDNLTYIAWSPDGNYLGGVGGIYLWNITNGDETIILGGASVSHSIQWYSDSMRVLVEAEGFAGIINIRVTNFSFALGGKDNLGMLTCSAVSPDGKYLATAGDQIVLRHPEDGSIMQVLNGAADRPEHLAFSPDGKMLASLSKEDGTIVIWKVP